MEDTIKRKRGRPRKTLPRVDPLVDPLPPPSSEGLTEQQWLWILEFRKTDDRLASCSAVGVSWTDVQGWLRSSSELRELYDRQITERLIACEDAIFRDARHTAASAKLYLSQFAPRHKPQGETPEQRAVRIRAIMKDINAERVAPS